MGGAIYADTGSVTLDGVMNKMSKPGGGAFAPERNLTVNGDATVNSARRAAPCM
jgi:hypothetical protein